MEDTIVAIATSSGVGAISIIRISGEKAIEIANKVCDINLLNKNTHTINYGHIIDKNNMIDEVLITVMHAPKTFTKENVVEINCHGGIAVTNKVLKILLQNGCRLAEPGEFTKRAYLNGRIDLLEAEGIMDMINAKSENARKLAMNTLNGNLSKKVKELREPLLNIEANINVNIDYPEYEDIEEMTNEIILPRIDKIETEIKKLIKESENGQIIKEGIKTVIIGKPNVGKSSLLNSLLEEEKAIVTDIPGTTRDIVEGVINLDGILLNIIDTAGIRKTNDVVESIGVQKSLQYIDKADLVLYLINNNEEITKENLDILEKIKTKKHLLIVNKIDLESKIDYNLLKDEKIIKMSILNNNGLNELKEEIRNMYDFDKIEQGDYTYISNASDVATLNNCLDKINDIKTGILNNYPIDIVEIDIKALWDMLGTITGDTYKDELIDALFSKFCLGK